jgi:hypothetical protein
VAQSLSALVSSDFWVMLNAPHKLRTAVSGMWLLLANTAHYGQLWAVAAVVLSRPPCPALASTASCFTAGVTRTRAGTG